MENPEETLQVLDEWASRRPRQITNSGLVNTLPRQLDEYLMYVARTGDPVFHWTSLKPLIQEKLVSAINEFNETSPGLDVPMAPNVDPFNYEGMRALLLERIDSFTNAPFTVQRLCELLTAPRKQYNRIDKFMRAVEKNVLVVSTREPGPVRREEEPIERALNGSDGNSDCGVDVDMEDTAWRDLRHPTIDPLAGASHRSEPERPDVTVTLPIMTTAVTGRISPPVEEKMDETPEIRVESPKPTETVEKKEETTTSESKPASDESMDIEVSKESETSERETKPTEITEAIETTKEQESEPITTVQPSLEEDSNSNPEPEPEALVPMIEPEPEPKPESVTSGEDSSSSNSSENTDGESERGGGDASRSPERSGASEGESSCEPPEQDEDSKPKPDSVPMEDEKEDTKETQPIPVEPEKYTVADIHTEAPPVAAATIESSSELAEVDSAPTAPTVEKESTPPPSEALTKPSEAEVDADESMQTETSEETASIQPSP